MKFNIYLLKLDLLMSVYILKQYNHGFLNLTKIPFLYIEDVKYPYLTHLNL